MIQEPHVEFVLNWRAIVVTAVGAAVVAIGGLLGKKLFRKVSDVLAMPFETDRKLEKLVENIRKRNELISGSLTTLEADVRDGQKTLEMLAPVIARQTLALEKLEETTEKLDSKLDGVSREVSVLEGVVTRTTAVGSYKK